jgi:hypothetical protein
MLAASDGTKAVQTPYIQAPTSEAGAARTFGGGNETLDGIEVIIGREASSFTGMIHSARQDTIANLKTYMCESAAVWLIDEHGNMGGLVDDIETPTTYYPIPIEAFFVGDLVFGNFEGIDMNEVSWKMRPNWSDKFVVFTPTDFNPLTDLVTP